MKRAALVAALLTGCGASAPLTGQSTAAERAAVIAAALVVMAAEVAVIIYSEHP